LIGPAPFASPNRAFSIGYGAIFDRLALSLLVAAKLDAVGGPRRGRRRPGRFASRGEEHEKTGEIKPSFRQAKRNVSQGMPQAIGIVMSAESGISRNCLFSKT
jgi:hypothetical protein